jgi:deferrochelatase/peroxidase EfeB
LSAANDFRYAHDDPQGFACPVGSHVRRTNPRDSLFTDSTSPEQAEHSANRHRLMRRGRSYGERLAGVPVGDTVPVDDGAERGLHFICLNADLERQFEFVQQTWVNNPVFGGLSGEVDPLLGDQEKVQGVMTIPADPLRLRLHGLHRFITVRGGAYFFLPGLRAIRYLASL